MKVILGLDPGGKGNFGWCIVRDSNEMPSQPIASGLADNAEMAVTAAVAEIPEGGLLIAAGIDAPLFWQKRGSREVDLIVRRAIHLAGSPHASGTVQDVNSLRGACIVQGVLSAISLRERFPTIPITEAHPKALLWLLPEAARLKANSEHERDALLAAVTAWAAYNSLPGWSDIHSAEPDPYSPISQPLHYFMPASIAKKGG